MTPTACPPHLIAWVDLLEAMARRLQSPDGDSSDSETQPVAVCHECHCEIHRKDD